MRHTPERHRDAADRTVKDIRRKTRKRYSSEDKIRIVLAGLRGEDTIAELCRQKGIGTHGPDAWAFGADKHTDCALLAGTFRATRILPP